MKAAPEGVAMTYENDSLRGLCEKYGISPAIEAQLNKQIEYLRLFKNEIQPNTITETQQAKALEEIQTYANKLKGAIEALQWEDRMALDNEFFGVNQPGFSEIFYLVNDSQAFDLAGQMLPRLERAAKTTRERIANVGKSGRPTITARQADFIRCIAQNLKQADIKPSHTGKFLEICTAILEEVGLALPDRAIRYFMKEMRPSLKASGYCL